MAPHNISVRPPTYQRLLLLAAASIVAAVLIRVLKDNGYFIANHWHAIAIVIIFLGVPFWLSFTEQRISRALMESSVMAIGFAITDFAIDSIHAGGFSGLSFFGSTCFDLIIRWGAIRLIALWIVRFAFTKVELGPGKI